MTRYSEERVLAIGDTAMKLHYYPETDTLYIELSPTPGADTIEISSGVVVDYDYEGKPVGIDIDNASKVVDLT